MLRKILAVVLLVIFCSVETVSAAATYGISYGYVPGYSSSTAGTYNVNPANDIPWGDLSHVAFFVALVNGTSVALSNPLPSLVTQAHNKNVRCYMTVGGANGNTWPTTNANCVSLADAIINLATSNGFDGVDIDCEFPGDSGFPGTAAFDALMNEIHSKAGTATPGLAKSGSYARERNFGVVMYLSPGYDVCGFDFGTLNNDVDWYTFSGYDLNIGFSGSYQGPLVDTVNTFTNCASSAMQRSLSAVSNWYNTVGASGTIPYNQMVLGMPMYGRDSVTPSNTGKSDNDVFINGSAGAYNTGYAECPYTEAGNTYGMDTAQSYCDKINWAVGQKGMIGVAMFDLGQGLQSGGPSNTQLVNIWNAISGSSACITVGTNPCAPGTCTATATATATPSCGKLIDNFESGVDQDSLQGYWSTYAPTGTTINGAATIPTASDGLNGSVYGGRMNGTTSLANSPSASCGLGLSGATYNASAGSQTGLIFTIRVDAGPGGATKTATNINMSIQTVNASGAVYATNITVPAAYVGTGTYKSGTPYQVTLLFSNMPYSYGGTVGAMDTTKLYLLSFRPDVYSTNSGNFDFTVDDIYFSCPPTPTPTYTFSPTPTYTPTSSPTNTATVASTNTATNTATRTSTSTSTMTNSTTNTPSSTSTATQTSSPTVTNTQADTNTPTDSPTGVLNTATYTSTQTVTSTDTISPTNTVSNTVTDTPNGPTNTQTDTPTVTSTSTTGSTNTQTPTSTDTAGSTATSTPTGLSTSTSTSTNTPLGPTSTSTNTTTPVPPTNTQTSTVTSSQTNTSTVSFTPTNTPTKTNTPTVTSTWTQTFTPTETATVTPTAITRPIFSPPYPNPVTTGPVEIDVTTPSSATIQMDVFTTSFRKIAEHTFVAGAGNGVYGTVTAVQWNLRDKLGIAVADGLYYVRIHVTGSQETVKIFKVLILR